MKITKMSTRFLKDHVCLEPKCLDCENSLRDFKNWSGHFCKVSYPCEAVNYNPCEFCDHIENRWKKIQNLRKQILVRFVD